MKVWHFFRNGGTTGEGRIKVVVGETLRASGNIVPCQNGLHGSVRAIDALQYAPGSMVQIAELGGVMVPHGNPTDKYAASERTCITIANVEETLRYFARWCALSAIDKWDAPQVVLDYLVTGDETLRAAARAAARDAAWDAAWDVASAVAWDVASAAASAAARAAAWAAASAAARAAAWAAARAAARDTAWDAAWDVESAAARAAQNTELERLLNEAIEVQR